VPILIDIHDTGMAGGGSTRATMPVQTTTPQVRRGPETGKQAVWESPAPLETAVRKGQPAMTMTDPIADMLTRLRNANSAYHEKVSMPYSKIKAHIAEILQQEGYVEGWQTADAAVGKDLVVKLKYGPTRERSIAGLRRVSKPGLRVYAKKDTLPRVLGGLGVAIISTSGGLMTDKQAKKNGVGGEVLAYVW
jgi:small subunit ribosomal protein S8